MIIVYTGNGKGKTSACVGQAVRALGQGFHLAFAQFMKKDVGAGEQLLLRRLLGEFYYPGGEGFFRKETERARHEAAARATLEWAAGWLDAPVSPSARGRMLVLDEALYALGAGLVDEGAIREIIEAARARDCHLVLSGRGLPDWLEAEADLVTELLERKHPAHSGVAAQAGIEF